MTRRTLTEQIDQFPYSGDGRALFKELARHSGSDEATAVIIAAAATLIAKQFPAQIASAIQADFRRLGVEFGDLISAFHIEMTRENCPPPALRLVGGTDA